MARPAQQNAAEFYHCYINQAKRNSAAEVMTKHAEKIRNFYSNLPDAKADHAYAEGKWTIKELLQHLIDAERVFAYRALRIARKDATPLASFDENAYTENSNAGRRQFQSLKDEFNGVRHSTDLMLQS